MPVGRTFIFALASYLATLTVANVSWGAAGNGSLGESDESSAVADKLRQGSASSTIPLRVELSGTRDCPSSDEFVETIVDRTAHARRAEGGEMAWSIELVVEAKGRSRLAQLIMRATEGPWVKREVLAPNCRQALDALSLVIAILVETAAEQAQSLDDQSRRKGEPARPLAPLPEMAAGMWIPWIDDPHFFEKRGVQLVDLHGSFAGIFGLEVEQTLLPSPNIDYSAGLEWSRWQPDLISPSYAAMLSFGKGDIVRDGIGQAQVSRLLLRASVCPVDFIRSPSVDLRPCVRLDGGLLWIETGEVDGGMAVLGRSQTAFVAKGGPNIALSIAPHPGISIRLDFGVDLMLTRTPIEVTGSEGTLTLYRPKWNSGYAGLGVGIGF
jgi:hypothetical protein